MNNNHKMIMTVSDKIDYEINDVCHICEKVIDKNDEKNYKVRDHDHFTGKFIGAAHNSCNLKRNITKNYNVPVVFHNSKGYDTHFIIQEIANIGIKNIKIIPKTEESYMSYTFAGLKFIDSLSFLNASLDSLVKNLRKSKNSSPNDGEYDYEKYDVNNFTHSFTNFKKTYPNIDNKHFNLLCAKGIYPYDYFTDEEKFNENINLDKEIFFNTLNDEEVKELQIEHAKKIIKEFKLKTWGQYHDIYLKGDVFLLSDVFENFRNVCIENYCLSCPLYYTSKLWL
jgi:hypothetical protein